MAIQGGIKPGDDVDRFYEKKNMSSEIRVNTIFKGQQEQPKNKERIITNVKSCSKTKKKLNKHKTSKHQNKK